MNETTTSNQEIFSSPEAFHAHLEQVKSQEVNDNSSKEVENVTTTPEQSATIQTDPDEMVAEDDLQSADVESEEKPQEDYKEKKFIPKSRFNQEIEKRRSLEEQLNKEREERIRYETQLQMINAMQQQAQESPEMVHEPELDPLDTDAHRVYMNKIKELENKLENINHETQQRTQALQYQNILTAQEQSFAQKNPDFQNALDHLKKSELEIASQIYAPDQAEAYVAQKMQNIVLNALNSGKNAAEVTYNMAKIYGYRAEAPKETKQINLDAINKNMDRTASIQNLNNSVNIGDGKGLYDIKHAQRDPKNPQSSIDPDKFHALLAKIKKQG